MKRVIAGREFDDHRTVDSALTVEIEQETGLDSIPTIERVYERSPRGKYRCVFPECSYTTYASSGMWFHVHSSRSSKHQ